MQSNSLSVKETRLYECEYDCNQVKVVKTCLRNQETQKLCRDTNKPRQPAINKTKPNKIVKNSYELNSSASAGCTTRTLAKRLIKITRT